MRVALVHEHLAQDGGAERVVRVFQKMFPQAPLYTLVHNSDRAHQDFQGTDIRTSFLQRLPGGIKRYQWYLPLMATAVESYDLSQYDLVLSSASSFAKGVLTGPQTLHLCYLHSPTRYLWSDAQQYVADLPYPRWMKAYIRHYLSQLRQWDRLAADRPDEFITNSRAVAARTQKYYRRDSTVVHPPIATDRFSIAPRLGTYYLAGGRLVPYKRFDLIVDAFNRLGRPLKIFGTGPALESLRARAKSNIEFLGRVDDREMNHLYGQAIAFINPQEEDFGMTAVEAMATGRPVIAYARGGALETVKPGVSGMLFEDQTWEAVADTVIRFRPEQFSATTIRQWAETFSVERFIEQMTAAIDTAWQKHQSRVA